MTIVRNTVKAYIIGMLADDQGIPLSHFKETDDLRDDYLFDDLSLVAFGKKLNKAQWHNVYITPPEIVACDTIKSLIDLVYEKISPSMAKAQKSPTQSKSSQSASANRAAAAPGKRG